jgi:CHAT domain-containing protein
MGEAATENVLQTYGPSSKSVHIATHGYFRQDNPMFSSIRLGASHLSLYDMAHLQLPVELVVLSGCATGLNVVTPGDELMGLVRGLLQAGAQSLVLSLWDVHDDSTKEFMVEFYTQQLQGRSKGGSDANGVHLPARASSPPLLLGSFLIDRKGVTESRKLLVETVFFEPLPSLLY